MVFNPTTLTITIIDGNADRKKKSEITAMIRIQATDISHKGATAFLNYSSSQTDISESHLPAQDMNTIVLYPNPTTGVFSIRNFEGQAIVFNSTGKAVKMININSDNQSIDISDQSKGVYFVKMTNTKMNFVKKVVVK